MQKALRKRREEREQKRRQSLDSRRSLTSQISTIVSKKHLIQALL